MSGSEMDRERLERRRQQAEIADSLKASGALDEIFARIDAGEPLTGHEGLLKGMLKASLERGWKLNCQIMSVMSGAIPRRRCSRTPATARTPRRWRAR